MLEHPQKSEVHCFTVLGRKMILAVDSCLFFETEAIVDEILKVCDGRNKKEIVVELQSNYAETDILTALEELEKVGALKEKDSLTSSYGPLQNAPIKSLALNVCHDCNLRCRYCYGNGGTYGGRKAYMKKEIAEAAVDFLLTNSEAVKKCSIIFFGGEPLLNFELIKRMVEYSEQQAVTAGKRIHFSLTTNGTLFTRQIIDYLNEKKIGVMVSIDGPKKIQDAMRPCLNGKGSYDIILPGLQRFLESRNGNVSARVTYTPNYLNLSEIAKHLSGLGFRRVYLSPATGLDKKNFILTSEHIISVKNELEKIARQTIELGKGDFREFSPFKFFLQQIHSRNKRIYPCGGGTTYFAVSPEGDIYLCQRFVGIEEFKVGNVLTGWDKNLTRILLAKPVDKRERCSVCWARYFCGGECYHQAWATTGDILTPDPIMCALTKCYLEISMGIYAWMYEKKGIVSEEVKSEETRHRSNTTKAKLYYQ